MTARRQHRYTIPGYGIIHFVRVDVGSGHCAYKIFWQRSENTDSVRIGWTGENQHPTCKLALWWTKVACALDEGKDRYHYVDSGTEPAPRTKTAANEPASLAQ